jgi:hypothetical protein
MLITRNPPPPNLTVLGTGLVGGGCLFRASPARVSEPGLSAPANCARAGAVPYFAIP